MDGRLDGEWRRVRSRENTNNPATSKNVPAQLTYKGTNVKNKTGRVTKKLKSEDREGVKHAKGPPSNALKPPLVQHLPDVLPSGPSYVCLQ